MRERLLWFLMGAALASVCCTFVMWHLRTADDAAAAASARAQADLANRLESLEARMLAVSEQRGLPRSAGSATAVVQVPTAPRNAGEPAPAPLTSAERSAASASGEIVEHAVRAGYWSVKDADDFAQISAGMRDKDRFELTRQLVQAINEDRLQVEPGAELR